ncbi:MAG: hypothetical protein FWC70_10685 [Defluviitaleaceae bacterium]|nr:hypothetical protein [Defluviitaleaceae bacterium]
MDAVEKTRRLIAVVNAVHLQYSKDYFETGKVEKINLSKTTVPQEHILRYRLNLHESINDYLVSQNLDNITYYYRVKTSESIVDKIGRYSQNADSDPVNNRMNDIFGARMILTGEALAEVQTQLYDWQETFGLKNWYLRDKDDYRGLHIYFKNKSNFYFPWELQLWDENDVAQNIQSHRLHKRDFVK